MAEKACHGFGSTTQVGLTQALDRKKALDGRLQYMLRVLAAPDIGFAVGLPRASVFGQRVGRAAMFLRWVPRLRCRSQVCGEWVGSA